MNDELEEVKLSLKNINDLVDIKENPVVGSVIMAPVKALPILGDLIDSSTDKLLENFQQKKEQELIEVILKDNTSITTEMVNDVEFIINYAKVVDAVKRLATNDKVKFFGNLIRNGYLSGEHIANSEFEECLNILNTMSYREIQYLIDYKVYCETESKKRKYKKVTITNGYIRYNRWNYFETEYAKKYGISRKDLYYSFMRIKQTGFIEEEFETEDGDVDDNTVSSLSVDSTGFCITERFLRFYEMVLKIEE